MITLFHISFGLNRSISCACFVSRASFRMFGSTVQIIAFTLSNLLLLIKRRMSLKVESSKMFGYKSFDNIYLVFMRKIRV